MILFRIGKANPTRGGQPPHPRGISGQEKQGGRNV